ncbi:MAG: hypothetical protein LBQ98_04490 [Nitrososphaerota archaeon]|nr:hypothetical protein [Nitrososphaerota archaeon]
MSDDPIASIAKGVTSAVIEWTEEKFNALLSEIRDGDMKIVNDIDTYQVMKGQKKSPEFGLFTKYICDDRLRKLFRIGLSLRALEANIEKRNALRTRTEALYAKVGLYIAEFIQNGFFLKYLDTVIKREKTETGIRNELMDFFKNFEKRVTSIKEMDEVKKTAHGISTRILSNLPRTYIIFCNVAATQTCSAVKEIVMSEITGYTFEVYKTSTKEVYFLSKEDAAY